MPGLGSPSLGHRSSLALDRDFTLGSQVNQKSRSSLLSDKGRDAGDRYNLTDRSPYGDRSSPLNDKPLRDKERFNLNVDRSTYGSKASLLSEKSQKNLDRFNLTDRSFGDRSAQIDKGVFSDRPPSGRTTSASPEHTSNLNIGGQRKYGPDQMYGGSRTFENERDRTLGSERAGDRLLSGKRNVVGDRSMSGDRLGERKPSSFGLGLDDRQHSSPRTLENNIRNKQPSSQDRRDSQSTKSSAYRDDRSDSRGPKSSLFRDDRNDSSGGKSSLLRDDRNESTGRQSSRLRDDRSESTGRQSSLLRDDRSESTGRQSSRLRDDRSDSAGRRSSLLRDDHSDGERRGSTLRLGKGNKGLLATLADDMEEDEKERNKANANLNKNKKKKRKNPITANLSGTRYDVVRQMVDHLGFTIVKDDDPNTYLLWNDSFVSTDRISEMKPFQRINHFPGMGEICRKDCLARNMSKMVKAHPEEYNFVPKTWILPTESSTFQNYARELKKKKKNKMFICKPSNGAMGNGICLVKNPDKVPQNDNYIVQEYLDKPFLIDGYKCDMRIYVLVTSCDPLRIFLYNDGLLRISTEKYVHPTDNNMDQLYMHLTNYSVNKHNDNYEKSTTTDTGSKRTLKYFNDYLRRHEYDVTYLWSNITDLIVKTLIVSHPHVLHAYRMCRPGQPPGSDSVCFEVLGFDVMLDRKLRPWLIEINRSPSFGTDEKLDYEIKSGVVEDSIKLLNIKASDKRKNMAAQKAEAQKRLLRPNKRVDAGDASELEKKRQSVEKKKDELKDILIRMRKDASREDHENKYCSRFKRIFPPEDKFRREKYATLLSDAAGLLLSGRASSLQQEIQRIYNNLLSEEDVLDMIAQCEADEKDGKAITTSRPPRGPKPLQSMPTLARDQDPHGDDDDDEDEDTETGDTRSRSWGRPTSGKSAAGKPGAAKKGRVTSGSRSKGLAMEGTESILTTKEREEDMTRRTLVALNDMRIKFPGKSDEEADYLLNKLHENWKFHKPRIASYWLVKLDSIKRRKVIDIVRSNVRAVLQKTWVTTDVETLHLYRIVNRVFNRLLWSHGQGLWNCFQEQGGNAWETIFSKSSESITPLEMNGCRRIVQLCRDCLLIVYQFAADAKNAVVQSTHHEVHIDGPRREVNPRVTTMTIDKQSSATWNPTNPISQRVSRLYHSRSQSLNSLNGPS